MQYAIDHHAVESFNANAPTVAEESFNIRSKTVTVEAYIDYYGTRNARVLIDGVCEDAQWNGDGVRPEWHLLNFRSRNPLTSFPYPKGLAQYKLRGRIGELAVYLWATLTQENK